MIEQRGKNAKKRLYLIVAIVLVLVLSGGMFAYTYTTTIATIGVNPPTANFATFNASDNQPNWDSVTANLSANTICGEVPTGDLFDITQSGAYTGDLQVGVYLTNASNLIKGYKYLNMKLYMDGSKEASQTPNYQLLTLQNGAAELTLENIVGISGTWTQTTKDDFESDTLTHLDTTTSPGDVLIASFSDNVVDTYDDETKIAYKNNLVVSDGRVKLTAGGASGTETSRPNAAGDDTNIASQYPASGAHWDKVDDATADDYTTYVYTNSVSYQRDLYNIPNHSTGSGAIDNVTAYFRFANAATTKWGIVYRGPGDDGWLETAEINNTAQITDSLIDTLEWDAANGYEPDIVHVSGNIYAIAYRGPGNDGWLATVDIDSSGNIAAAVIDTLEWDAANGYEPDIVHVSGNIYAIAYRGTDADGWLATVDIDSSGNIAAAVTDTLEWDAAQGYEPVIVHVSGNIYAIAYRGPGSDGWVVTMEIDSSGNITNPVIDSYEWDASDGWEPDMAYVAGNFYAIVYRRGASNLGYLITVQIATDGQITNSIIDTLQFEATYGFTPKLILVSGTRGNVYTRAAIKTQGTVYTGSEESTATDAFVTRSYQWTNNPDTGEEWTWSQIDSLQIGVELRAGSTIDVAACTQVYIEVNYTAYSSPGTLLSINLLSAETVYTIDSFGYNALAIPSGTGLRVQFSTDNATWYNSSGTPGGWDILSQGTDNISLSGLGWSGPNLYYKMEFTSDGTDTPVLEEIIVYFSICYTSGTLISSDYDTGDDFGWDWETIYFTINEPSGTNIQFQLRSAATQGGLSTATWYGPTGTGDYYTTSGTAINPVHDGDRWIQYRAYFSGPGDNTPKLSDISLNYSASTITYTVEIIGGGYCLISDNTSEWAPGWTITPEFFCQVTHR